MSIKIKRLTSLLLTALILVNAVFFHTYAIEDSGDKSQTNEVVDDIIIDDIITEEHIESDSLDFLKPGDKTLEELKNLKVDKSIT